MKKLLLLLLLPFLFISCVSSKRMTFLQTTGITNPDSINIADYETKYGEYDGVYLDFERTFEHSGTSTSLMSGFMIWDYNVVQKDKYIVFNPDKEALTTFTFSINKRAKIGNFYLRMCSPDRRVTIYGLKDCIKQEEGNFVTYKFIYPDVKKGTIIEEALEYTCAATSIRVPLEHDLPLQFNIPCENLKIDYSYPEWWVVKRKKIAAQDPLNIQVIPNPDMKKITFHYEAKDIQAIKDEPFSPFFKEIAKYLKINVFELHMGSIMFKNPDTWEGIGNLFKDYAMNKDGFLSSMVSDTTEELIKDCKSDFEKMDKIISYIQTNIEVDSSSLEQKNFKRILKTRKGDVLSVNGLAQSMLTKAGLKTEYLLIHTASEGFFDADFPDAEQFRIPAVRTTVEGKQYILLPQYKYLPVGCLLQDLQDQPVLVISNEYGAIVDKIRNVTLIPDTYDQNYKINIDDDGLVSVKEEKTLTGVYAYEMRNKLLNASEEEREKLIKEIITYNEGKINLTKYQVSKEENYKEPLVISCEYTIDNLVTITPEEVIFQTAGLFSPSSLGKRKMDKEKRHNPIRIFNNVVYTRNVKINYPSSWKIQTELKDVQIENTFGNFKTHFELSGQTLSSEQHQELKKCYQPKEKYNELVELTGSSSNIPIPALVFKKI